jgi:transcriptional regulator with XRE-family HTH domain
MHGSELLTAFLETNKVSREQCAAALKVSRTALYYWLTGQTTPGGAAREDIETWTNGEVAAASWGPHADHRKKADGAACVEPFVPASDPHGREA